MPQCNRWRSLAFRHTILVTFVKICDSKRLTKTDIKTYSLIHINQNMRLRNDWAILASRHAAYSTVVSKCYCTTSEHGKNRDLLSTPYYSADTITQQLSNTGIKTHFLSHIGQHLRIRSYLKKQAPRHSSYTISVKIQDYATIERFWHRDILPTPY